MAFFSLTTHQEHQQRDQIGPDSFFLYRNNNEDNNTLYKGFELWQQQQQQQQQFQEYDFYTPARGLTAGSVQASGRRGLDDGPSGSGLEMMMSGGGFEGGGGGGGVISCQDCGNQAKKDCVHMRCRTCCKSRGFNCQTHVKSTWVPAAVRREKQQHNQQSEVQSQREIPKRQRDKRPSSSSAGLQVGEFPSEFTAPATFRCVRVSSINDTDEEYAYQTAVNIGGHVFRGILYDQGPDKDYNDLTAAGETSTGAADASAAAALFDTCNYPSPLGTFVSGMPFFYNPRS